MKSLMWGQIIVPQLESISYWRKNGLLVLVKLRMAYLMIIVFTKLVRLHYCKCQEHSLPWTTENVSVTISKFSITRFFKRSSLLRKPPGLWLFYCCVRSLTGFTANAPSKYINVIRSLRIQALTPLNPHTVSSKKNYKALSYILFDKDQSRDSVVSSYVPYYPMKQEWMSILPMIWDLIPTR